jgi:hypothetical protein
MMMQVCLLIDLMGQIQETATALVPRGTCLRRARGVIVAEMEEDRVSDDEQDPSQAEPPVGLATPASRTPSNMTSRTARAGRHVSFASRDLILP